MAATFKHSKYIHFSLAIKVNGETRNLDFKEGFIEKRKKQTATLKVTDQAVIDKIKILDIFKKGVIVLVSEEKGKKAPTPNKTNTPPTPDNNNDNGGDGGSDGEPTTVCEGITNGQGAKEVLVTDYDGEASKLRSNAAIIAYAKEVNVSFPDWEAFNE